MIVNVLYFIYKKKKKPNRTGPIVRAAMNCQSVKCNYFFDFLEIRISSVMVLGSWQQGRELSIQHWKP